MMRSMVFNIICLLYSLIFLGNLVHLACVKLWFSKNIPLKANKKESSKRVYLFVPVLNEQNIIVQTYKHFTDIANNHQNIHVVFVPTNKEKKYNGSLTTKEMLERLAKDIPCHNVHIVNYPYDKGVMAHQLNYAIRYIRENIEMHSDFWIGVYNADSRITEDTVAFLNSVIVESDGTKKCFQQYSWYLNPSKRKKSLLSSASLWQSRWSLLFELYRVIYQISLNKLYLNLNISEKNWIIRVLFDKMNYVIGHGLFITDSVLFKAGGFPEDTINEDAYLGYILNQMGIEISPIPFLECADFATSLKSYIKQQTVWFNGPLYAFQYMKLLCSKNQYTTVERIKAFSLSFKLFLHAVYWLIAPLVLYIIPVFCITSLWQIILWMIIITLEMPVTGYEAKKCLITLGVSKERLPSPSVLFCPIFYMVHCIGPIRGLLLKMIGKNRQDDKYKTER